MKRVSILLSCYQADDLIQGYIDDLLYPEILDIANLIVVDFPHSHRDPLIVENQLRRFPDLVLIREQESLSLYDAWNIAISAAHTDYVSTLNLDDRIKPGYYAKAIAELDSLAGDVFSSYALRTETVGDWDNVAATQEHIPLHKFADHLVIDYGIDTMVSVQDARIVKTNPPHCAPVWRRSLHSELGWFSSRQFDFCADYAFWLKVAAAGKRMLLSRETLTLFHSVSGTASDRLMHPANERILEYWKSAFPPRNYKPSRLGLRNNFMHFGFNMNAIFSSPCFYSHLGSIGQIDRRLLIGINQPDFVDLEALLQYSSYSLLPDSALTDGKTPRQYWFDTPEVTVGKEWQIKIILWASQRCLVKLKLEGLGTQSETVQELITLEPLLETQAILKLTTNDVHPAFKLTIDPLTNIDSNTHPLILRSVKFSETRESLGQSQDIGFPSFREANRLAQAGNFRRALVQFIRLYQNNPLSIYRDNAFWCASKLGISLDLKGNNYSSQLEPELLDC